MAIIVIDPLIDLNAGAGTDGATGTVEAVAMRNGLAATRLDGSSVTLPEPVVLSFKDGILEADLDLDLLPADCYWRMIITIGTLQQVYYFIIPADVTTDLADLEFIDPRTFESNPFPPNNPGTPVAYTPTWSGTGLTLSSTTGITGDYVELGRLVFVNIYVPFTNVTNFGTGQYSVSLPFAAAKHTDAFAGSVHQTGTPTYHWSLKAHLITGSSTASIWYIGVSGNKARDTAFDHQAPFTLTTADLFHLSFWYEKTA
jgi:hypothetical protein